MNNLERLDKLMSWPGVVAAAVTVPSWRRSFASVFRGPEVWRGVVEEAVTVLIWAHKDMAAGAIRIKVTDHVIFVDLVGGDIVAAVLPGRHALGKSIHRVIRTIFRTAIEAPEELATVAESADLPPQEHE